MPPPISGALRNVAMRARHGHDAREDDEADAVADAALGDQLADAHGQDRAGGQREDLVMVSRLARSNSGDDGVPFASWPAGLR